ncbi:Arf-GAP with GTPase, ANK repeat and PH domain-containing protein 1 [Plecturocebus cupreus]
MLLIRDEEEPPEGEFAMQVNAVIVVFSLKDEDRLFYHYYSRMAIYQNTSEILLVLVGTNDPVSSTNLKVIDSIRARKPSNDLKRCLYYEMCAKYWLNMERVFHDTD